MMSADRATQVAFDAAALDALFSEVTSEDPAPLDAAFRARLIADARAEMVVEGTGPGWMARLRAALAGVGGAPGLAGMAAAGVAGLWIGVAEPGPTADLVSGFWQGAAWVAPTTSGWSNAVDDSVLGDAGSNLLSLIDGEIQ